MEIKTKFNIGDEVFYLDENKIKTKRIDSIQFDLYKDKSGGLRYRLEGFSKTGHWEYFKENELFSTKEELIASL